MPITFKSKHSPDILMLEATAKGLLHLLGHSGGVPGALAPQDIPDALAKLRGAIAEAPGRVLERRTESAGDDDSGGKDGESGIGVAQRAAPLINMLENALRQGDHVMWEH